MSDIVERLREYAEDDHERGCAGRCYDCSCGYDSKRDPLLNEAADEIEKLRADLQNAVMSDTEYCAELERINKALMEALTVDVDVVVPERDYSAMTPRDCYEAGLLDGVYQARAAIKAAVRAALGGSDD